MQTIKSKQASDTKKIFQNITSPFLFIRHGETDWNAKSLVAGSTDVPLNQRGIEQAEEAAELLKNSSAKITKIISSPLKRALNTAEAIQNKISSELIVFDDLREANFGVMEGAPVGSKEWIIEWDKGKHIEGAETSKEFATRIINSMAHVLTKYEGPVLIVAHGGVWIQILKYFSVPLHDIPNAVPYHVDPALWKKNFFKLVS